jgi:exodeoxyribonuclease-3
MKIASWNVNSIRARLNALTKWLDDQEPDVLLLQETKVVDDDFPSDELTRRGYSVVYAGQKAYNGVAILSQMPIRDVTIGFPGDASSADKRLISASIGGLRIVSGYIPNGKDITHEDFGKKLAWLTRLRAFLASEREKYGLPLVMGGDFNVAREARDIWSPELYEGKLHFHPDERKAMSDLLTLGLSDSFRLFVEDAARYSWWDYRGPSLAKNQGLRIDYLFIDETLVPSCRAAEIDSRPRHWDKPSDHVPVWVKLERATSSLP